MKTLLITLSLFSLIACDAPQRTRLQSGLDSMSNPYTDNKTPESGGSMGSGDFNQGNNSNPPPTGEYSHCDYSYKYHTVDIGHFAVCQSRNDETKFKFRTQIAHQNVQICLIPTYREGSSSTYLGRAQCTFTQAGKDYEGRLYKDRNGFSHRALNGVIVLKYGLHNSYFRCMNASLGWPGSACSNGPYTNQQCYQHFATCPQGSATPGNNNCAALANAHMVNVCEDFKRTYSSSYADISTR